VQAAARAFATAGAGVDELKLPPSFADLAEAGQVILEAEAAAYHEPSFAKFADQYGAGIRSCVESGLKRPATAYVRATRVRQKFRDEMARLLASYDGLISPTAPAPAPRGLEWTGDASLCQPWSTAGFPSITLPSGVAASGLPHAVQLSAMPERNAMLLYFARWCEVVLGFSAAPKI
jgi:Asp-tRNA(Asn)/Glu-tRNA(Gln) amidotransferase A subunit family amidase